MDLKDLGMKDYMAVQQAKPIIIQMLNNAEDGLGDRLGEQELLKVMALQGKAITMVEHLDEETAKIFLLETVIFLLAKMELGEKLDV